MLGRNRASLALIVVTATGLPRVAAADDFDAGSYVIPMDLDFQDFGMLRAYGLVYDLLLNNVPVRWSIREGKAYGEDDFTATCIDFQTGVMVGPHDYRGGPFIIDADDAPLAEPIITTWIGQYPETTVHEATEAFSAPVSRYLVVAPTIAMVADGNEDIARGYMQAAGIPDSTLSLDWAPDSPDMLSIDELAGPTDADGDGALFDDDGNPVYCQLMSMHWGVGDAQDNVEVVEEVEAYLNHPTHFFAECQAVNAFENLGLFLTPNGFEIGQRPDVVDFLHMDSPFGQIDGPYDTVGGSEPAYTLPAGDSYLAGDITMITEAGTPEGINDVWMTGFLDGACPPDQHECGTIGKVSYLGGHEYRTDLPISTNPDTQGTRMFLNSLFEAPCATIEGLPNIGLAVDAPEQTTEPAVTLHITFNNTSFYNVLEATLVDPLPPGVTFVSASDGGMLVGDEVVWDLGNLGPSESGDVSIEVTLDGYGTYLNSATLHYRVGLTPRQLGSNTSQTEYAESFPSGSTGLDGTGDSGDGGGTAANPSTTGPGTGAGGSSTSARGTESDGYLEDPPEGCSCRSGGSGGASGPLWALLGLLGLSATRRRRIVATVVGSTALGGCAGGSEDLPPTSSGGSTSFGLTTSGTAATAAEDADDTMGKLDAPPPSDIPFPTSGCQKIDFLFVIDSSESMKSHQENLVTSFPGFVTAVEEAVAADDWHVMVVDTDGQWNGSDCANACASLGTCPDEPAFPCDAPAPELCDITMGSGMRAPYGEGASNMDCGLEDRRFIDESSADLDAVFGCVARVGVDGSPVEHTAEALVRGLSAELADADGCNAGFLRDDAILVITLITDEPDLGSEGDATTWADAIAAAKNGDPQAVVLLGLLPDGDTEMPLCPVDESGPVSAPRLGALLDAFDASTRASVCAESYGDFLTEAVSVIADTCDDFEPPA